MCVPQLNNRRKSNAILYLPLICTFVLILGYLMYIAGPWRAEVLLQLYKFKFIIYYIVVIIATIASLLYSYLRRRSWRYFLPLVMPVAVVYILLYNFHTPPSWESGRQNLSLTQLIAKSKKFRLIKIYYDVKNYVKGKKLVVSPYYAFFRDVRFELTVDSEIVLKEYPYVLTEDEFTALMEKPLITQRGYILDRLMPHWVSLFQEPGGEVLKAEKIYAVSYEKHLFLIPEDYFMHLKGLTKTDLEKYKEKI